MTSVKPGNALRVGLGLIVALLPIGCGGGGGSSPPPPVSVTVTPSTASLPFGGTQQFTAAVTGTSNAAVTWSVKGGGTISLSGFYTAPSAMLSPGPTTPTPVSVLGGGASPNNNIALSQLPTVTNPVTITATSQADTTKSASASVTISALSFIAAGLGTSGGGTAFTLSRGTSNTLFMAGNGFLPGTTYAISGPTPNDITVTQPSDLGVCQTTDKPPLPCATVPITVNSNAQLGPRNIIVTNQAGEMTVFVGGLVIQ